MVKTRAGAKTTVRKPRPKPKRTNEPQPLYLKNTIVAIPGREAGNDFKLVKLLDAVYEQSENVRVVFLKAYEHEKLLHIYYEDTVAGEVSDSEIISEAAVVKFKGRLKSMGFKRSLYELRRHDYTKIKALAKNFQGIAQEEEESDIESEEEEEESEEEEEEEEAPARPIKKVAGKKGAAKKKAEEEEEMEEQAPRRSTRNSAKKNEDKSAKKEEVTRSTKKQKVAAGKKGKATKEEELDEEEEDGDGDGEEEEEEEAKPAAKTAGKAPAKVGVKGKKVAKGKKREPKVVEIPTDKYVKGYWNPDVTLIDKTEMLEGKDNHVIEYGSTKTNNKNIIRAVNTKNYKLLEECLNKDKFFSNLFQRWGVDSDFNAIEIAFKNKDEKAIQMICKAIKDKKPQLTTETHSNLNAFDSGRQSRHAYGAFTRRLNMGRGNKELNNAFTKDQGYAGPFDHITMQRIMEMDIDNKLLDTLRVEVPNMELALPNYLQIAVQSGNIKVAAYIAQKLFKATGHGVNLIHTEVLTKDDPKDLSDFKKPSATAKTINTAITPIHFACINPNAAILDALLTKVPEYSIADFQLNKPVHYAAACTGPEPLKLLISRSVDFREGNRSRVTPLMIACTHGRIENVNVLLNEKDETMISHKTRDGMTALHCAAERGHLDCIKALHAFGCDLDAPGRNRMTPLIMAAANGHFDCVEWLLANGAKILAKDKFRRTALVLAVMNGHTKIVSYLLQRGADFKQSDSSNNYPIHYAAAYGFTELLDVLKEAGADQNVSNALMVTPLTLALLKNNDGAMKKLLSYEDTDVNCKDELGRTLIMCAIQALTRASFEQIKFLIKEKSADVNIVDMQGLTALHYVCELNIEELAQNTLNFNRNYGEEQDQEVEDQKHKALVKEYQELQIEIAQLLIDNGADINKQNLEGLTPFFIALQSENFEICKLLIKHKDLNITGINKKDEGVYHLLSKVVTNEKGFKIFSLIADLVKNENGLLNHVDIQGFTPILKFIKTFVQSAQAELETIYTKHEEAELSKKQKEWEAKHKQMKEQAKPDSHAATATLRGGARTFQTARKSTGGKAPRKMLASKAARFGGGGLFVGGAYGAGNNDERPVTLSFEEIEKIKDLSQDEFDQHVDKFINLIKRLIDMGARIDDSVQRLRPFRKVLRAKDPKLQDLKVKLIADIIKKRREEKNKQNQGFGLFGGWNRYNRYGYGQQRKPKNPIQYCPQGNQNALHLIQAYPHPKLVNFFLSFNTIDINQQDYMKRTPLYCFIKKQDEEIGYNTKAADVLETLLNHKADPNLGNIKNELPAFMTVKLNKLRFLELLAKYGVNLDVTNKDGETPLILSVKNKQLQYAEILLKAGANPNIKGKRDRTALHYALNASSAGSDASFEMEGLLLKHGANINEVDRRGRTPLHYAFVKIGNPFDVSRIDPVEIVTSYCAQKDVDVNVKDKWGCTPLHYAAQRGAQVCALTLLTIGKKVDEKDGDGNTALAIALKSGHPNVAIMLVQSSAAVDVEVNIVNKVLEELRKKEKEQEKKEKEEAKAASTMEVEKAKEDKDTSATDTEVIEEEALVEIEQLDEAQGNEPGEQDSEFEDEPEEEEDDEDQKQNQRYGGSMFANNRFGGGGLFGYGGGLFNQKTGNLFGNNAAQNVQAAEGKYSLFTLAIKKNYQGVAYLILQSGYDLMSAVQDAMNEQKFNYVWTLLTKVEDQSVLHKTNQKGQNLFHTFAIQGRAADSDVTEKIFKSFTDRGISFALADNEGRTPLHYAAQHGYTQLIDLLLSNGADLNVQDKKGYTPFTLQLAHGKVGINEHNIQTYIKYHAKFDLRFKVTKKGDEIEMGPLTYLISSGNKNFEIFRQLLNNKVSINETDELGRTGLMYSIKENSDKLVSFFLNYPDLDRKQKDNDGRTPIHYVVNPLEFGSYENETILEMIAPYFDINEPDGVGKAPIYYAYLQDSGVMAAKLKALGAKDNKPAASIKRAATSVIAGVDWSKEEIDYEEDADKFIEEASKVEKEMIEVEEKVKPDQGCGSDIMQYEVVYDDKLGPYDLYMTKVDVQRGYFGGNVFYKMQLLHNRVRDYYSVMTRFGRIGEFGSSQNTPYPSKDESITQFNKIFKSKSGNDWANKDHFQKYNGKYRLLEFSRTVNHKEYLVPFDLKNPKVPKCQLDDEIKRIVNDITDVKMYQQQMTSFNVDTSILPLARLNRSLLNEAQAILFEIRELIEDTQSERRQDIASRNNKKLLEIREKISEKSSRFYELIPDSRYKNSPIPPIDNQHELGAKSKMLDNLLDFEISSRIMLGALNKTFEINPLDYCFQALTIKMLQLEEEHPEYLLIKEYIQASHDISNNKDYIKNIFALERKGEAQRFSQWTHLKNRMLLWHGSKIANFMGILGQGLRISPPEAHSTGEMFGKGIYFGDQFSKSIGYTHDWNGGASKGYSLLLLCEVALGEMLELKESKNITELQAPYKSVKGVGRYGPRKDHKVVLANGCVAPIGQNVDLFEEDVQKGNHTDLPRLHHNEYIVYDVSQVRVRYLVQVKNS